MTKDWPVAELDPIRRLRVIAATTPGVVYAEQLIPAPFGVVWTVASDLENELPRVIGDVRSFEVIWSDGDRLGALARSRLGMRARFDVVLRPGWCLMQSRFLVFGMAAVPEGDGTRFAGLGGLRLPGGRLPVAGLLGPLNRRVLNRVLGQGALRSLASRVRARSG